MNPLGLGKGLRLISTEHPTSVSQKEDLLTDWTRGVEDDGDWQRFKGSVRERWAQLTDDEIEQARGNLDHLVGAIKSKTGESAGIIKDVLSRLAA
jgi:uncharacterized protein YjbJ (UPF0337 family)